MTQKTVKFDENVIRAASASWKKAVLPEFSEAPTAQIFAEFFEAEANCQLAAIPEDPSLVSLMCQIQRLRVGQSVEAFGVTLECGGNPLVAGASETAAGDGPASEPLDCLENDKTDQQILQNQLQIDGMVANKYYSEIGRRAGALSAQACRTASEHECVVADLCGQVRAAKDRAEKAEAALLNGASYMATAMRSFEGTEYEDMHRKVCSAFGLTITPAVAVPLTVKWSGK